jgi:hypothetical protein
MEEAGGDQKMSTPAMTKDVHQTMAAWASELNNAPRPLRAHAIRSAGGLVSSGRCRLRVSVLFGVNPSGP